MSGDGRHARVRRGWSDLPGDVLDMVYRRCCSSRYDHIRFAAVCTSWSAVASWHPKPPALPLLLPSTGDAKRDRKARAYILEDGRALRRPLPGFPWGKRIVGSHDGGWVAALAGTRLFIMNVFSGTRVALSAKQSIVSVEENYITKVIFSEDPSSSGCILAAMTTRCKVALCWIGLAGGGWLTRGSTGDDLTDIAFCNGGADLYGLSRRALYRFVIGADGKGAPMVTLVHRVQFEMGVFKDCWDMSHERYIFEFRGKLAIAMKFAPRICCCKNHFFRVFEFDGVENKPTEVTSLGDHALFLGPECSKAVHMPLTGRRGRMERSRIYYSEKQPCPCHKTKCLERLDLGSYALYYGKNKGMLNHSQRIGSSGYHYCHENDTNGCTWLLPPDL
ncbi:uncharacterized protein [Lolium perenne]|uniref:uncharacterized protein n=1 Tax=Lolium perenne TaxID=4522 RepID=UPI0021F5EFBF|nr:uncharacterized protein LOC127340527 [Lolium perenne]